MFRGLKGNGEKWKYIITSKGKRNTKCILISYFRTSNYCFYIESNNNRQLIIKISTKITK